MQFIATPLPGLWLIEPVRAEDERGFFARTYDAATFAERGLQAAFPSSSISFNRRAGTLRGLHYQAAPHEEVKLVRCTMGAVYDVVVDLRRGTDTFRRWYAVELTAQNRRLLYVPTGCAHGYQTLVDDTELEYQIAGAYAPAAGRGCRWDDRAFGIEWPDAPVRTMNERDRGYPEFNA